MYAEGPGLCVPHVPRLGYGQLLGPGREVQVPLHHQGVRVSLAQVITVAGHREREGRMEGGEERRLQSQKCQIGTSCHIKRQF